MRTISDIILCHHERWDGNGYPQGLAGEEIPLLARIISIADSFDAMTEERPYGKTISKEAAKDKILMGAGTQYDPLIARLFTEKVLAGDSNQ